MTNLTLANLGAGTTVRFHDGVNADAEAVIEDVQLIDSYLFPGKTITYFTLVGWPVMVPLCDIFEIVE